MKNIFIYACMLLCFGTGCQKETINPRLVPYLKESTQTGRLSSRSTPREYEWLAFGPLNDQANVLVCMLATRNSKSNLVWGSCNVLYVSELFDRVRAGNLARMLAWTSIGRDIDRINNGPWIDLNHEKGTIKLKCLEEWIETYSNSSGLPFYRVTKLSSFPEDVVGVRLLQLKVHSIKTCDPSEDGKIKVTAGGEMPFCYAMDLIKTRTGKQKLFEEGALLVDVKILF